MAVRSSLQKFLALFKELKAAAGNDPSVLSEFDKAPDELRAATRLNSFAKTLEEEIIYGPEKMIAHAPRNGLVRGQSISDLGNRASITL